MNKGMVPAKPFVDLIDRWVEEETNKVISQQQRHFAGKGWENVLGDMDVMIPRRVLQTRLWPDTDHRVSDRRVFAMRHQEAMKFDTADRIVCCTYGPGLWVSDPVLSKIYDEAELWWIDVTIPVNENISALVALELDLWLRVLRSKKKVARAIGVPESAVYRLLPTAA